MRLSELIWKLQQIQEKEGDLLTFFEDSYYGQGGGGKSLAEVEPKVSDYDYKRVRTTFSLGQVLDKEGKYVSL